MASTFDTVANIIAETCDIPREKIQPESHALDDLEQRLALVCIGNSSLACGTSGIIGGSSGGFNLC